MNRATFVVVGGGIAGVTCVEHLCYLSPNSSVILITVSPLVKSVTNVTPISKTAYTFDVNEVHADKLQEKHRTLSVIYDELVEIIAEQKKIITRSGRALNYEYLALCTGAIPKVIPSGGSERVLGIRDTGSVKNYLEKIGKSKKIIVIGNGGIASELVYATRGVHTMWVIKDKHISSTFVDPGAAEFFRSSDNFKTQSISKSNIIKRTVYAEEETPLKSAINSAALGPDWLKNMHIEGLNKESALEIIYQAEVEDVSEEDAANELPLSVKLSNGVTLKCDLVISATGVIPRANIKCDVPFKCGSDGGISVDWRMETSVKDVYAAGDVCHADWDPSPHWFQMRLWTQAHQMGGMAARSMNSALDGEEIYQDFCFEMFSHTTKLFGYPVVLLGKFNGQGYGRRYEILVRTTPNLEYIKFVIVDNKLQGVVLIGDTGLEETCENLILNQIDLTPYGDDILNPDIDIEDYFD